MIISREVEEMCPVAQGVHHGAAPVPTEGKWVKNKDVKDISGLTHGIGWCAPQQGACKLTLNVKEGIIQEALVETIGCSGMTHSAAMASEILPGLTVMEALNTDLVCDAINTAMRELFLQIVYGRSQSAFSEDGLPIGAGLEDLGKGLRSQVGTMYGTLKKGPRYLEMAEGYVTGIALDADNEIIGYKFVNFGKMMDFIISYKCGSRQPQVQDWNGINAEFQWFVREFSNMGKNLIFIAHRDSRKEGDKNVFIPFLREKNYNAIVTELDLLGYLEMKSEQGVQRRTITFDPTDRNDGKNTCNLPSVMNIPTVVDAAGNAYGQNNFIADRIIKPYLGMLNHKIEEIKKYTNLIDEISEQVELITDAQSANDFAARINNFEHVGSSLMKARSLFAAKVAALNLVYDKETKTYSDATAA